LERVERTANGLQSLERHAEIAGGGPDIGMPQQNLNGAEIGSGIQHVRGACVPKQVRMNQTWQAGAFPRRAAQHTNRGIIERLIRMPFRGE
jgi:hypothetical protein